MSLAVNLRLAASEADRLREDFERLHFCAEAHIRSMRETDAQERCRTLQQLNAAVKATARSL